MGVHAGLDVPPPKPIVTLKGSNSTADAADADAEIESKAVVEAKAPPAERKSASDGKTTQALPKKKKTKKDKKATAAEATPAPGSEPYSSNRERRQRMELIR